MTIGVVNMTNAETLTEAKEVKGSEKRKRLADLLKNQKKDLFFTRCAQIKKPEKSACKGHFPVVVSISLLKKSSTTTDDMTWIHSLSSLYELVTNRKELKKLLTSIYIQRYNKCTLISKMEVRGETKTCPAGFEKTFPILYENKTEMQP